MESVQLLVQESGVQVLGKTQPEQVVSWPEITNPEARFWLNLSTQVAIEIWLDLPHESFTLIWPPKLRFWEKQAWLETQLAQGSLQKGWVQTQWLEVVDQNQHPRTAVVVLHQAESEPFTELLSLLRSHYFITGLYALSTLKRDYALAFAEQTLGIKRQTIQSVVCWQLDEDHFGVWLWQTGQWIFSRRLSFVVESGLARVVNQLQQAIQQALRYLEQQGVHFFPAESHLWLITEKTKLSPWQETLLTQFETLESVWLSVECWALDNRSWSQISKPKDLISYRLSEIGVNQRRLIQAKWLKRMNRLSWALLIAWLGHSLIVWQVEGEKQQALVQQITQWQAQSQQLSEQLQLTFDAQDLKQTVLLATGIEQLNQPSLLGFKLDAILQVLTQHVAIHLTEVSWQRQKSWDDSVLVVTLSGWVGPFEGDYQQPVAWVDRLVQDLRQLTVWQQVNLTQEPLERKGEKALSVTGQRQRALPFQIEMLSRPLKLKRPDWLQ